MKFIDRLIALFDRRSALRMGAVQQPTNLNDVVYEVHSRTFEKITGKKPIRWNTRITKTSSAENLGKSSRFRRIGRRM